MNSEKWQLICALLVAFLYGYWWGRRRLSQAIRSMSTFQRLEVAGMLLEGTGTDLCRKAKGKGDEL